MDDNKEVPSTIAPKKKRKKWPWIIIAIVVVFIIAAASSCGGGSGGSTSNKPTVSNAEATSTVKTTVSSETSAPLNSSETAKKAYSATLKPGYYEIGVDIPAGTYDFAIASGSGNVTTTSGDVNLIMGKQSGDMYQKTYKNAELNSGDTLFLQQCSIKISTKNADMAIKKRDNSSAKAVTFSSGKYTAGKDFQPGYYDITIVSGSGNVICEDNELNAMMGKDTSMYVKEYKNVHFEDGNKLDIEGPKVKLTPSK
jgi:hypothetical protein